MSKIKDAIIEEQDTGKNVYGSRTNRNILEQQDYASGRYHQNSLNFFDREQERRGNPFDR